MNVISWPRQTSALHGGRALLVVLLTIAAVPSQAASPALPVSIHLERNSATGLTPVLSWPSQPGAVYRLQTRPSLSPGATWQVVEPVTAASESTQWRGRSIPENSTDFYRIELPQPEIFSVEPAIGSTAGGTTMFVIGQCLGTNGQVRLGGLTIPVEAVQTGAVYRCVVPALQEGVYDVEWFEAGQVSARGYKLFSVTGQPTPVGQRLLEPPVEPPASPRRTRTGNVLLMDDDPDAPALKVKEKGNRTKCGNNLRMLPSTGELQLEATDLFIPGRGLDFVWTRTYRSRTGERTVMGHNWDHSYNILAQPTNAGVAVSDGTGRQNTYFLQTNGTYACNEFFNEGTISNNAFTLTFPDAGRWEFLPFNGSVTAGKISRIVDRNGNALTFLYDGLGRMLEIMDTLGRTNRVSYNALGQVQAVTDFTGRSVTYQYYRTGEAGGANLDLKSVTTPPVTATPNGNDFPGGKTNTYAYSRDFADDRLNHNLLRVTDPKGQVWLQVAYRTNTDPATIAFDTVDYLQRGSSRTQLRRGPQTPSPTNGFAVVKAIVNDGVGNVSEHFHDSLNRCVRQLDYTGRANPDLPTTETQNRPVNKLRQDDPDFFETRFEWNLDSLCRRVVHPRGNEMRFIYERDFNPAASARKKGDLRILRELASSGGADLDGDGSPDLTERVVQFRHDPRFGSDLRPWLDLLAGEKTALVHQELHRPPMALGFAASVTDARGGTMVCSYDPAGNLLEVRHPDPIGAENFEYNAFGQRTAHVHFADAEGRRRRDEFSYYSSGPQLGYREKAVADCIAAGFHITNRYEYDSLGRLTRHIDPRGFDTLWTHNALDQVTSRTTPSTSFGSLVRSTTTFTHDANDNLIQVDHENRDESGALDPVNPQWTSFAEYDLLDRQTLLAHELTHVVQQRFLTNRFAYDANGNLILEQLPEAASGADPDNAIAYQYDERDLLFGILPSPIKDLGEKKRFDYDGNGNLVRIAKISAITIRFDRMAFDGFDRLSRATNAMGNVETFAFDANDNLTYNRFDGETNDVPGSAGNRRLREARYEYDGMNRLTRRLGSFFDISTQMPVGDGASITRFTYAPNGQLTRETDDNGHSTAYRYDSAGRLSGVARGVIEAGPFEEGVQVCAYTYDAAGHLLSETTTDRSDLGGPLQSFSLTHEYDGLGRLVRSVDNVGNTNAFAYDSRDNCVSEIDANGNETVRAFDGLNRCVQTIAYESKERGITINTSHVEYQNRRCVSTTDGNGNTTTYAYDSLDRHVLTTHADGTTVSMIWSPRSNLERLTDANGTVIQYTHDLLDRCVRKDITPGAGVAATTTFEEFAYDGRGNLVFGTNNTSMVEFEYNCAPGKGEIEAKEKAKADCIAARASFDGEGNRVSLTYPDGREVRYAYDSLNRVTNVSQFAGGQLSQLASYAYDGPGRLARVARANGINTRIQWSGVSGSSSQIPGDFGWQQMSRINHARAGGSPVIDQRVCAYDRAQNKTLQAQTAPFVQGGPLSTNFFAYDKAHRLLRAARTRGPVVESDNTYVLDPMGNRTNVIGLGGVGVYGMLPQLPEPGDFQMSQYTLTPFGAQQHDRNGNVIMVDSPTGGTMFHYDYADRLVAVERAVGPALVPVVSFTYDALGRRITRTAYPPAPLAPVTTRFYHDLDSDGDDIIEFQRDGATVASFVLPEVEDEVLVAFTAAGAAVYFHQDDLGNVLALTDATGTVLERYDYDDYGAPSFLDAKGVPLVGSDGLPVTESPLGNPFLFHGMFWEGASGLYHAAGREGNNPLYEESGPRGENPLYDPRTGRCFNRLRVHGDPHVDLVNDRDLTGNNPWSRAKKVHNFSAGPGIQPAESLRARGGGRTDTYVWKLRGRSREDVYVWKVRGRSREDVYVWKLKKEEGGRHTPFHNKYRPQSHFRTTDVTGEIVLESGREMIAAPGSDDPFTRQRPGRTQYANITLKRGVSDMRETTTGLDVEFRKLLDRGEAGDNVGLLLRGHRDVGGYRARLIAPIAMDKGLRFAIREGGRTVGAGQVIEIVK